jgi:hypothetical protein
MRRLDRDSRRAFALILIGLGVISLYADGLRDETVQRGCGSPDFVETCTRSPRSVDPTDSTAHEETTL